jgi:hypothetical protein
MTASNWPRFVRIAIRVVLFTLILSFGFGLIQPEALLGKISGYNLLFPGRTRFPFGEYPQEAYNMTINNLDAMFASHEINNPLAVHNEYRVLVVGDSSVWGTLLRPEETLSGQLNALGLKTCDGRKMRFYNMGYPTLSWMKDLVILSEAQRYDPDMIIWMVTLESAGKIHELESPILLANPEKVAAVIQERQLQGYDLPITNSGLLENNLLAKRRDLADIIRLQVYGTMWAATGIDQVYPDRFELAQRDFEADATGFYEYQDPLQATDLAVDLIDAGRQMYANIPVLVVNEPIMISSGENSDVRYNYYYPRWAYDQYRQIMTAQAKGRDWQYLDLWNLVGEYEFTNTAIHTTPNGTQLTAQKIGEVVNQITYKTMNCLGNKMGTLYSLPTPTIVPTLTASPTAAAAQVHVTETPRVMVQSTPPVCNAEAWQDMAIVPGYVSPELIQSYQQGLLNGNNAHAISVIGDCQNVPSVFLGTFDDPASYRLGEEYAYLQPVIDYYKGSFARRGVAVSGGYNVASVLSPLQADPTVCEKGETPLDCELRLQKPGIVFISMETWWSKRPADVYEGYMRQIIERVLETGAIPILATKADDLEGNHEINQTIVKLGCEYQIPVWNFWKAVQPLPDEGLWTDGFHLTVGQNFFDNPGEMTMGRTMRNLSALQSLYSVWSILQQEQPQP